MQGRQRVDGHLGPCTACDVRGPHCQLTRRETGGADVSHISLDARPQGSDRQLCASSQQVVRLRMPLIEYWA